MFVNGKFAFTTIHLKSDPCPAIAGGKYCAMSDCKTLYRLTNSLPYMLNRVGAQMGELFSRRIAGYRVTLPMYRVMAALLEDG